MMPSIEIGSGDPTRAALDVLAVCVEEGTLDNLPGNKRVYLPWQQLHQHLREALAGAKKVAMQYSPLNAIPYISRVDAGTVELVRSFGVEKRRFACVDEEQIHQAVVVVIKDRNSRRLRLRQVVLH